MEEMLLIPRKEAERDVDFFKGELTGNAWLEQASQLAAAKKRVLQVPRLSAEEAVQKTKPLSRKLLQANRRLRQILPVSGASEEQEGQDEDFVSTGLEKWLKRFAKGIRTPKVTPGRLTPLTTTQTRPSTSGTRPPVTPKPTTLRRKLLQQLEEEEEPPFPEVTPKGKKGKTLKEYIKEGAVEGLKRAFIGEELGRGKRPKKAPTKYTPAMTNTTQARQKFIATGKTPASRQSKTPAWKPF